MVLKENQAIFFTVVVLGLCIAGYTEGILSIWGFLIPVLAYLLLTAYGSAFIGSQMFVPVQTGLPTDQKKICLSFDDGPHPNSLEIADVLREYNVPAVFFCIGKNAEAYPEIVQLLHAGGHLIGNHSYSHSPTINFFSGDLMRDEIQRTDALLQKLTGEKCLWYRPPYGVTNHPLRKALKKVPHGVLGWNLRTLDTIQKDPDRLVQRIIRRVKPGSIILLHDPLPHTVATLRKLIPELQRMGYTFALPETPQIFVKPGSAR